MRTFKLTLLLLIVGLSFGCEKDNDQDLDSNDARRLVDSVDHIFAEYTSAHHVDMVFDVFNRVLDLPAIQTAPGSFQRYDNSQVFYSARVYVGNAWLQFIDLEESHQVTTLKRPTYHGFSFANNLSPQETRDSFDARGISIGNNLSLASFKDVSGKLDTCFSNTWVGDMKNGNLITYVSISYPEIFGNSQFQPGIFNKNVTRKVYTEYIQNEFRKKNGGKLKIKRLKTAVLSTHQNLETNHKNLLSKLLDREPTSENIWEMDKGADIQLTKGTLRILLSELHFEVESLADAKAFLDAQNLAYKEHLNTLRVLSLDSLVGYGFVLVED